MAQQLKERTVFADPETIKHYLKLHLAARSYEVFAVIFLDAQNRLLAMEDLFRGTLTQLSVTFLRKYFGWVQRKLMASWPTNRFHLNPYPTHCCLSLFSGRVTG